MLYFDMHKASFLITFYNYQFNVDNVLCWCYVYRFTHRCTQLQAMFTEVHFKIESTKTLSFIKSLVAVLFLF